MLLALDSATRQAGICLFDGVCVRAEALWSSSRVYHTEWLTPAIAQSLARINALKQLTSFLANITAATFLLFSGRVVWSAAAVMAVGALTGGVLAGRYVHRASPGVLRTVVAVIAVAVAVAYLVR
ncbi:MAG: TSUP family transporter [Acidimicrobiales bacterium]